MSESSIEWSETLPECDEDETSRRVRILKAADAAVELFYSFNSSDISRNISQNLEFYNRAEAVAWNARMSDAMKDEISDAIVGTINLYPAGTHSFVKLVASVLEVFRFIGFHVGSSQLDIIANIAAGVPGIPPTFANQIVGNRTAKYALKMNTQDFELNFTADNDGKLIHIALDYDRTAHLLGTVVRARLFYEDKLSKARARSLVDNIEGKFRYLINKGKADKTPSRMAS